jgi:acyl carrier protein
MTSIEIHTALRKIALEELDWKEDLPTGSLSASLDSMQKLSLVVGIEDHFHICFEPEEETSIDTVEALVSFIQKKKRQTQS